MPNKIKMKLKNNAGCELVFQKIGFTAPIGEFDVTKSIGDILLKNDAITLVEKKKTTKIKAIEHNKD
jgi:hypothetical protein